MNAVRPARAPTQPGTQPMSARELQAAFERVLDAGSPAPPPPAAAAKPDAGPVAAAAAVDIGGLMGLEDRGFIESAYLRLLHRPADEAGMEYYLRRLAAGFSRVIVLGELRFGPEGRAIAAPVPGLRARLMLHRLYRVPVFGGLLRTVTGAAALPGVLRDLNRLWAELHAARAETAALRADLGAVRVQAKAAGQSADSQIRRLTDRAEQAERALLPVQAALRNLGERLEAVAAGAREEPWAEPVVALAERGEAQAGRIAALEADVLRVAGDARRLAGLAAGVAALREQFGWPENAGPEDAAGFAEQLHAMLDEQRNTAVRALSASAETGALLRDQERRLSLVLDEVRRWAAHGVDAGGAARMEAQQASLLDPLYVAFEDRFRGSRADIKGRQAVYLDLLREAGAGAPGRPVVDVGSGRGELLELLGESGLEASGVDTNEAMVALCQRAGLRCVRGDAVAYLNGLEPGSLGAVTGFHIIEHLPFPAMVALLDASLLALAPGGLVIFETPNPANLLVASRWFHLDPTHRNPLPGETVAMIAEARGFTGVQIRELHPMQRRFEARDTVLAGQLDAIFHGPQDYALIARKP